jgi:hypothetical protein
MRIQAASAFNRSYPRLALRASPRTRVIIPEYFKPMTLD